MNVIKKLDPNDGDSSSLFDIKTITELDYLLDLVEASANMIASSNDCSDFDRAIPSICFRAGVFAIKIIYHNIATVTSSCSATTKKAFLEFPFSSLTNESPSRIRTYRQRLYDSLQLVLNNHHVDPKTNILGEYAVKLARMRDIFFFFFFLPSSAQQFYEICALLRKNESHTETMCERALIGVMMGDLEGAKLFQLLNPGGNQVDESDGDESSKSEFIQSLLLIADRGLTAKILGVVRRISDESLLDKESSRRSISVAFTEANKNPLDDIARVLDSLVFQTFSLIVAEIHDCLNMSQEKSNSNGPCNLNVNQSTQTNVQCQEKVTRLVYKYLDIIKLFVLSLTNIIRTIRSSVEQALKQMDGLSARQNGGNILDGIYEEIDERIASSHLSALLPLCMFSLSLLYREFLNQDIRYGVDIISNVVSVMTEVKCNFWLTGLF